MPLSNEAEIKEIIVKLHKAIELEYIDEVGGRSYNYVSYLLNSGGNTSKKCASQILSEEELSTFIKALSENEIEVNKLIVDNFSLSKFFNKIKNANIKHISGSIVSTYENIQATKKTRDKFEKKNKENISLYRAARLSARQKQVLNSLGINLANYERPEEVNNL